jgi:hypothetical protein
MPQKVPHSAAEGFNAFVKTAIVYPPKVKPQANGEAGACLSRNDSREMGRKAFVRPPRLWFLAQTSCGAAINIR